MNRSLRDCYDDLLPFLGPSPEPYEVLARADEHREYWRPRKVRLVLLAESHVYTLREELDCQLKPHPLLPSDLPRGYVRLVYSLGYGEDDLLDHPIQGPRNSGTPQFWKLFYACTSRISICRPCWRRCGRRASPCRASSPTGRTSMPSCCTRPGWRGATSSCHAARSVIGCRRICRRGSPSPAGRAPPATGSTRRPHRGIGT